MLQFGTFGRFGAALRQPVRLDGCSSAEQVRPASLRKVAQCDASQPGPDDLGNVDEFGKTPVVIFQQGKDTPISTIRVSADNYMDDVERIDDGVNTYKSLTKDNRVICGAGATEVELARQLHAFADSQSGLEQYAIHPLASCSWQ